MRRLFAALFFVVISLPGAMPAQERQTRTWPPIHAGTDSGRVLFRGLPSAPSGATRTRGDHARIGALAGAVVGAIAGVAGSTAVGVGCTRDPCNTRPTRISFAVLLGSAGAIAGAGIGAGLGALLPVSSRHP